MEGLAETNLAKVIHYARTARIVRAQSVPAARRVTIAVAETASAQTRPAQTVFAAMAQALNDHAAQARATMLHATIALAAIMVTSFVTKPRAAATAVAAMPHAPDIPVAPDRAAIRPATIGVVATANAATRPVAVIVSAVRHPVLPTIPTANASARIARVRRALAQKIPAATAPAATGPATTGPAPRSAEALRRIRIVRAPNARPHRRRAKPPRARHWPSLLTIPRISSITTNPSAPPNCWPVPVSARAGMSSE